MAGTDPVSSEGRPSQGIADGKQSNGKRRLAGIETDDLDSDLMGYSDGGQPGKCSDKVADEEAIK